MSNDRNSSSLFRCVLVSFALLIVIASCGELAAQTAAQVNLLPAPREVHLGQKISLPAKISVLVPGKDAADEFAAKDLEEALKQLPAGHLLDQRGQAHRHCGERVIADLERHGVGALAHRDLL